MTLFSKKISETEFIVNNKIKCICITHASKLMISKHINIYFYMQYTKYSYNLHGIACVESLGSGLYSSEGKYSIEPQ